MSIEEHARAITEQFRRQFEGIENANARFAHGMQALMSYQDAIFEYIFKDGAFPHMSIKSSAYGDYTPVEGQSETDFPRVVQEQGTDTIKSNVAVTAIYGRADTDTSDAPSVPSWPSSDESKIRSLADRITNVMGRDKEAG